MPPKSKAHGIKKGGMGFGERDGQFTFSPISSTPVYFCTNTGHIFSVKSPTVPGLFTTLLYADAGILYTKTSNQLLTKDGQCA